MNQFQLKDFVVDEKLKSKQRPPSLNKSGCQLSTAAEIVEPAQQKAEWSGCSCNGGQQEGAAAEHIIASVFTAKTDSWESQTLEMRESGEWNASP